MLPGLTRTAAQPASIAAKTYFGWKWMSAITGICDLLAIAGSASASSWLGHGDPHDLAAGRGELGDLLQRRVDVGGQRRGHRLHGHRRAAADRHRRRPSIWRVGRRGRERRRRHVGHAEVDGMSRYRRARSTGCAY